MIGTIDVAVEAKSPNLPLFPMRAFVGSPSSIRVRNVPKRVGDWNINKVYLTVVYPDGTIKQADCVQTGGVWVGTVEGTATSGTCENGYTVFADGTDENGNSVTGYVLGKGDVEILHADGTPSPDPARYSVKLLSASAEQPIEGDMWPTEDGYVIWQGGQAHLLGTPFDQISAYVESAVSVKADLSAVPTNVSQLSNDSGFITSADVPTKTSELSNDSGYVTSAQIVPSQINAGNASTSDKSLVSQALAEDASDEHSTRVVVDEYGNVILQKYTTGWYVSKIEEGTGSPVVYTETDAYYAFVSDIRIEPSEGRLYYTAACQDKQRNLPSKQRESYTTSYSEDEFILNVLGWDAREAGHYIAIRLTVTNAETPVWVDAARLVPDSSKYSGLLDTQITPNGQFLTPAQVKPYDQIPGYASKAYGSLFMFGRRDVISPDENKYVTMDYSNGDKLVQVQRTYPSWFLSQFQTTTFDLPLEMKYGYVDTYVWRAGARTYRQNINSNCWVASSGTNCYYIKADENGNALPVFYVKSVEHPITFSQNELSVETMDGETGNIACTRSGTYPVIVGQKYVAYEDDVSAALSVKADLSAIPTKTSQLSNDSGFVEQNGTAVINSLTCDQLVANQAHIVGYVTSSDLSAKRDLNDLNIYVDPMAEHTPIEVTVWHNDEISTLYVLNWDGSSWYYTDGGTSIQIYFDNYSNTYIITGNIQDMGGTYHTISGSFNLTSPFWSVDFETSYFYKIEVASIKAHIATKEYVDSRLSALEARIAALEGN